MASLRLHRRHLFGLVGGLLLFFGARWAFQQGTPERLQDLTVKNDSLLGIHKGVAYFNVTEPQSTRHVTVTDSRGKKTAATITPLPPMLIRALPIASKQGRLVGEDRRPDTHFQQIQLTGDNLYYYTYPEKPRPISTVAMGVAAPTGGGGSASVVPKPQPEVRSVPVAKVSLFQMNLAGGSPVALRPDISFQIASYSYPNGQPIGVVGDNIYWVEVENRLRPPGAVGSLRVISRHGGPPETLMTGLPPDTVLAVPEESKDSLWMCVSVGEQAEKRDLYLITAADRKPRRIMQQENARKYMPTLYPSLPLLSLNGRLYWTQDVNKISGSPDSPGYGVRYTEILSTALDGSDQRTDYTFPEASYVTSAHVHKGKLYLEIYRGEARQMQSNRFLVRLEPGPPVRVQDVFHFPLKAGIPYFDGEYIYYTLKEERDNFWDWSNKGLTPVEATVLCRYRLR